jgi:Uma2 family endonuclease
VIVFQIKPFQLKTNPGMYKKDLKQILVELNQVDTNPGENPPINIEVVSYRTNKKLRFVQQKVVYGDNNHPEYWDYKPEEKEAPQVLLRVFNET